jgi:purine-nucleoside phosphorylase
MGMLDIETLKSAAKFVSSKLGTARPGLALVLGSGWAEAISDFEVIERVSYADIPGLGATKVQGHSGELSLRQFQGQTVLVFSGRKHLYEGSTATQIAIPVAILRSLEVPKVLLTNAAGGIRSDLEPGDLMIMNDHLNLMGFNPLVGADTGLFGPRFPDMSTVYNPELQKSLEGALIAGGRKIKAGVYVALRGPSYETPAEIKMFKTLGADAVGMSTVPEAILANASGIKVAGLSCISNFAAGIAKHPLSHSEVVEVSARVTPVLRKVVAHFAGQALGTRV